MTWIEAVVIGLLQGLTEFLPVSSSGHIELSKIFFDVKEENIVFTIFLHAATALSTIVVFRKEIRDLILGLFRFRWNEETRFTLLIIISMIPAVVAGVFWEDEINSLFNGNLALVSSMLIVTGILLFVSDRIKTTEGKLGPVSAFVVGISQAIAILPGISRSGSTIGTAVILGIRRETAARFSFLMVLPIILGAAAKSILDLQEQGAATSAEIHWIPYLAGFVAAFVSGIFACRWMIALVKRSRLIWFAVYCWIIGMAGIFWVLFS